MTTRARACARWRPTRCCCTCRRRAATGCASSPASAVTLGPCADRRRRRARQLAGRQLPLRRPQPAVLHRRAIATIALRAARVRRRAEAPATPVTVWGPWGDFVLRRRHRRRSVVRRLRHRLRAGQEPDRARAGAGRRAVAMSSVLAGHRRRAATSWPTSAAPGPRRWTISTPCCW
ncbi:MAG: hypothetical protein MZW92_05680 [Comamonadaceae bacterium]|nr:hypothetical protein [Comamonadaceae bacterium]